MPTGDPLGYPPVMHPGAAEFEPSAALSILDGLALFDRPDKTASAWDAAWIACLTNSPRWAEAARREFAAVTDGMTANDG